MTAVAMHAALPAERESVQTVIADKTKENLKESRVIFTVADTVSDKEKISLASTRGFGGVYRPELHTIKHNGNPGMIYRCKLTVMQEKMTPMNADYIPPGKRDDWVSSYTQSNSKFDTETNTWGDLLVDGHGYLKFKAVLPGNEVKRAIERTPPNGTGGIVEITALRGKTRAEVNAAQVYYFPNWSHIQQGIETLPFTVREIQEHIKSRMDMVQTEVEPEKRAQYVMIGREMLQSCEGYRNFGMDYVKSEESEVNRAKVEGRNYQFSPLAERLLEQLEMSRKDEIVQDQASATQDLVREMKADRESKIEVERLRLENENLKLQLQLQRAGLDLPEVKQVEAPAETPVADEPMASTNVAMRICGKPTANGECKRELKDGEVACWQHTPKEIGE